MLRYRSINTEKAYTRWLRYHSLFQTAFVFWHATALPKTTMSACPSSPRSARLSIRTTRTD
jgi:hypothetical protein